MPHEMDIVGSPRDARPAARNPWLVLVLSVATLGVYGIWWWYRVNADMAAIGRARQTRALGDSPVVSVVALLAGVLFVVPALWTAVATSRRVRETQRIAGVEPFDPRPFALLSIATLGLGLCVLLQRNLNRALDGLAELPAPEPHPAPQPAAPPTAALNGHALWRTAAMTLVVQRTGSAQASAAGAALGVLEPSGAVTDASGSLMLRAPIHVDRRKARMEVLDAQERPLGGARVASYSIGPRSLRGKILVADPAGAEVGALVPRDRSGEEIAISTPEGEIGVLRRTARERGLRDSTTTYDLELTAPVEQHVRALLITAAMRYETLIRTHSAASRDD